MEKEILKNGLFDCSKISVCRYIARMNEEFDKKFMAEAESFREERAKLQKRIEALGAELASHKQNTYDVGEDMVILASQTDDALNTFVEQFLSLRQDFEDSES